MAVATVAVPKSKAAVVAERHPVLGFGAQLNAYVFTQKHTGFTRVRGQTQDLTEAQHETLKAAVKDALPGHCRIFVQRGLNPDSVKGLGARNFTALFDTLELAQLAGAQTVNLTWWGQGPYAATKARVAALDWPSKTVLTGWPHAGLPKWPKALTNPDGPGGMPGPREQMRRFARIIHAARRQFPCVTHATIQNEPNGGKTDIAFKGVPNFAMRLYEHLYRCFADALAELDDPQGEFPSLRQAITIVAGDLVQEGKGDADHQDAWIRYLHANMDLPREGFPSVLDAYSIHVYWKPGPRHDGGEFPDKATARLDNLADLAADLGIKKPIYITEYGVRFPVPLEFERPGNLNGVPMERAPESVFEHAWFNARAPQKGFVGLVKWVMYRTDMQTGWGKWGLLDSPGAGSKPTPMFHMARLFNRLVGQDWLAAGMHEGDDLLVSRFTGPAGAEESIIVLNSQPQSRDIKLTGLSKGRRYEQAAINADGNAGLSRPNAVTADNATGAATVKVPVAVSSRSRPARSDSPQRADLAGLGTRRAGCPSGRARDATGRLRLYHATGCMTPTISDIARLTGLSKSTVSRALNDSPLISAETKERVRSVADRAGVRAERGRAAAQPAAQQRHRAAHSALQVRTGNG